MDVICLLNCDNERDLSLLISRHEDLFFMFVVSLLLNGKQVLLLKKTMFNLFKNTRKFSAITGL